MKDYPPGIIAVERVYEPDMDAQVNALKIVLGLDKKKEPRDKVRIKEATKEEVKA